MRADRLALFACACQAALLAPATAQPISESPVEVLQQAIAARDAAQLALDKANQAIIHASALLERSNLKSAAIPPAKMTPFPKYCDVTGQSPGELMQHAEDYALSCLKDKKTTDIKLTGIIQDTQLAVVAAYTRHHFEQPDSHGNVHSRYNRFRLGVTVAKQNSEFPLYDFGASKWLRGYGLTGGYEFGRTIGVDKEIVTPSIATFLMTARHDCIAEELSKPVTDPLTEGQSALEPRSIEQASLSCDGANLNAWMQDPSRRDKYFKAFSATTIQPDKDRALYGGVNLAVAFPQFQYVAGLPIIPVTGQAAKPTEQTIHPTTHEFRVYAGGYTAQNAALEFGLSHRRAFEEGTDHTICPVGSTGYLECWSLETESPSEVRGFVADARFAFQANWAPLPTFAILLTPSYEFDTKRKNYNGSVFFASDADGKLTSGVSLKCSTKGVDLAGKPLKKACKAELFASTAFTVRPNQ